MNLLGINIEVFACPGFEISFFKLGNSKLEDESESEELRASKHGKIS